MNGLVKAKYNNSIIECYPLAVFLWKDYDNETKKHKFLFFSWFTNKIVEVERLMALVFIPWKHSEKEIALIPAKNILASVDSFNSDWVKSDIFKCEYKEPWWYKSDVIILKQFQSEDFIFNNKDIISLCICHEYEECLAKLYKEKHSLLELEFDEDK